MAHVGMGQIDVLPDLSTWLVWGVDHFDILKFWLKQVKASKMVRIWPIADVNWWKKPVPNLQHFDKTLMHEALQDPSPFPGEMTGKHQLSGNIHLKFAFSTGLIHTCWQKWNSSCVENDF